MLLFRTVTGSRQHGFATLTSDYDIFEVYSDKTDFGLPADSPKTEKQTIQNGNDMVQCTLSKFANRIFNGSHQALDAVFSNSNIGIDLISEYRAGFRLGSGVAARALGGTLRELIQQETPKRNRHALRVAYNLAECLKTGRYIPELTPDVITEILDIVDSNPTRSEMYAHVGRISGITVG